ncbi:MAG: SNF2-related protein [Kiritimatiellae bacterium]|nr:SNF2-related protein [Kiritimatiellia bacterium]
MTESNQNFKRDDFVRKKHNPGMAASVVDGPINDAGDILWKVRLPDGSIRKWEAGTFELVRKDETILDLLHDRKFGRKLDFSQLMTFHRLTRPLTNNIYSLHSNKIDFYPFQFKPLLKFIDSPNQRLLIADDVGLGKTIEAGLILSELKFRTTLHIVLVVCPAHLREKWQLEMLRRFGEEFTIVDASGFRQFLTTYKESYGPVNGRLICSIQSLRSDRMRKEIEEADPRLDLVIVDEAHYMRNSGTQTHALGRMLSQQAEALLFLTATPVQTQIENLYNLLRLLDENQFQSSYLFERQLEANEHVLKAEAALSAIPPDYAGFTGAVDRMSRIHHTAGKWFEGNPFWNQVQEAARSEKLTTIEELVDLRFALSELNLLSDSLTRTRKVDVKADVAHREAQVLHVEYTEVEDRLYQLILDDVRSHYCSSGTFFEKVALLMPQRRAASSIIGAARYYLKDGEASDIGDYLASFDDETSDLPDEIIENITDLQALFVRAAEGDMPDTKYDVLVEFIRTLHRTEKLILFSTFPSTLEYLRERLEQDGFPCNLLSGKVPVKERPNIVEQFRNDQRIRVLLSSEVGGEGLDLQFCSIIVNYDLPWNPMVVAQRIGRIDRIGQRSPVIRIINFSVKGTIDQIILERLYNRIQLFERSIGLIDGILGEVLEHIADALFSSELSEEARQEKIELEERAIQSQLMMVAQMQSRSDSIFIYDNLRENEVELANRLHRYVSDAELETLVTEFLSKFYPRTVISRENYSIMTYNLDPDTNLRSAFRGFRYKPGERVPVFLGTREPAVVTFDVNIASDHSTFEHINITHPLVRLVVQHYRDHGCEFAKTSHFELASREVPPGYYLAMIHKFVAEGVRPQVMLMPSVVSLRTMKVLDENAGEILVATMITEGVDAKHLARIPFELPIEEAYSHALQAQEKRDSELRRTLRIRDRAFRARRVATLRSYYDRRISRQGSLAREHEIKGSLKRTIKGFWTRAKNLANECESRINEVENGCPFDSETEEVLAAVVRVYE